MLQMSQLSASTAHVKGAAVLPLLAFYERRFGAARLAVLVRSLAAHAGTPLEPNEPQFGLLASSWYEAGFFHALLEGMLQSLTSEERACFAREGGRAVIEATLMGVYRWLFQAMMTPERYARNAQRLFDRYYDTGSFQKEILGPRRHRTRVSEWRAHHPIICDSLLSSSEYIYASMGCIGVQVVRTACVDDGAAACVFEITWES